MYYKVYIDVVFLTNLVVDYLLLRLLTYILKCRSSRIKALAGAVVGAAGACLILILPTNRSLPGTILLHGVLAVLMVKIGCSLKTKGMLLQAVITLYFTAFLFGGFWEALSADSRMTLRTFLLLAVSTYALLSLTVLLRDYFKMRTGNLYKVHVSYQGKVLRVKGYYDTGNQLMDLTSKKPVSVISWRALGELLPEKTLCALKGYQTGAEEPDEGEWRNLKPHFLTFQSVGNPSGMALAITLDEMCIHGEHEMIWIHHPVMAMPQEEFLLSKDYQIILNANLM